MPQAVTSATSSAAHGGQVLGLSAGDDVREAGSDAHRFVALVQSEDVGGKPACVERNRVAVRADHPDWLLRPSSPESAVAVITDRTCPVPAPTCRRVADDLGFEPGDLGRVALAVDDEVHGVTGPSRGDG